MVLGWFGLCVCMPSVTEGKWARKRTGGEVALAKNTTKSVASSSIVSYTCKVLAPR